MDAHDHRRLGQRLDLFHFQDEAPGMVFWHPRGLEVFRLLEGEVRRLNDVGGFREVRSPQLMRRVVWERSGHAAAFAENMFVVEDEPGREAALKPVSCPGHIELFRYQNPSHHDLPIRYSEFGLVHRKERSGSLRGLFRLRQFTQDDGHVFCLEEHVAAEVAHFCASLDRFYRALGFDEVEVFFSSRPAVRLGSDAAWDRAEALLREAGRGAGLDLREQPGEGAFYGPKLEFVLRDREGREWQCGTIQLDLVLPERFDVSYVDRDGARQRPLMIHRAVLGSVERFLGVLLEHHRGHLPPWLAPAQALVLPVADAHGAYASEVANALSAAGLRASADLRSEPLSRKVAEAERLAVPFVLVVGAREAEARRVSLRGAGRGRPAQALEEAIRSLSRQAAPPSALPV